MSIKRDVITRTQIYTIYSSETQERMKVYFSLNEEYNKCLEKCPKNFDYSDSDCQKDCEKIYDQYSELLFDRYKDNKEKLDQKVKNLPSFTTKTREDRKTLFYKIFGY